MREKRARQETRASVRSQAGWSAKGDESGQAPDRRTPSDLSNPERGYGDPLSQETRTERRSLLITDVLLMVVVWGSLVPTKIDALGLELASPERYVLLAILLAVNIYFFFAFRLYSRVDSRAWTMAYAQAEVSMWEAFSEPGAEGKGGQLTLGARDPEPLDLDPKTFFRAWQLGQRVYFHRHWFDVWFPVVATVMVWILCLAKLLTKGL